MAVKERVITIATGLTESEIKFLDRKIDGKKPNRNTRAAILRFLVRRAMAEPGLLE
jgi:hypothetical protein